MTLFLQLIRPAGRAAYWTAWIDPAGNGSGIGRTKAEALGNLMLLLAERQPEEVELRLQPTADYRPKSKGGA